MDNKLADTVGQAMYGKSKASDLFPWDSLPAYAQQQWRDMAYVAHELIEKARQEKESEGE